MASYQKGPPFHSTFAMTGYTDCQIDERTTVGYEHESGASRPEIGADATIRAGTIIYCDVTIGDGFATGKIEMNGRVSHDRNRPEAFISADFIHGGSK